MHLPGHQVTQISPSSPRTRGDLLVASVRQQPFWRRKNERDRRPSPFQASPKAHRVLDRSLRRIAHPHLPKVSFGQPSSTFKARLLFYYDYATLSLRTFHGLRAPSIRRLRGSLRVGEFLSGAAFCVTPWLRFGECAHA